MNQSGQHMPNQTAHTQPQPGAQMQKPITQGPQSQRQMAPNVQSDASQAAAPAQAKPATKRFAIVDPKTNKELTAEDVGGKEGAEKSAAAPASDTSAAGGSTDAPAAAANVV